MMIRDKLRSDEKPAGLLVSGLLLTSLAALVGQIYGLMDMTFALSFLALPAVLVATGIVTRSARDPHRLLPRRVLLGIRMGAVATVAYDGFRYAAQMLLPLHFNAFAIHGRFGELILGEPRTTVVAQVAGWTYHITNGLTFGICYALVAGRARWWYGLIYGMVLEGLMVLMYPTAFGMSRGNYDFLTISFIGHAAFGTVLGVMNQRRNWRPAAGGGLAA